MMYSFMSITTRAKHLSAMTIMKSLSFLRFSSTRCSALVMFVYTGLLVKVFKNSIDIMVEATAVNNIEFTCLESCHSSSGDIFFDRDDCLGTANFGPFCSRYFSSGVSSFLERLITHLSWILELVQEMAVVLKVLEAILEVIMEALEMRLLSFLILVLLYCRKVFSLLLKMVFCRFVKAGSSHFCC